MESHNIMRPARVIQKKRERRVWDDTLTVRAVTTSRGRRGGCRHVDGVSESSPPARDGSFSNLPRPLRLFLPLRCTLRTLRRREGDTQAARGERTEVKPLSMAAYRRPLLETGVVPK